jgi:hypothetical protein
LGKSKLSQASYEHDLAKVRALLRAGAPADGSGDERWHGQARGCIDGAPIYFPLGEACRSEAGPLAVQLEIVDALLRAGAPVDERDHCANTALLHAARQDRPAVLRHLLAAGADRHAVGGDGNAVATALRLFTPDEPGGQKVACLRLLLQAGVDPRGGFPDPDDLLDLVEDPCEDLAARDKDDRLRAQAILELMEVLGEACPDWSALQAWLHRAREAHRRGDARARKLHERLVALGASVGTQAFAKAYARQLGSSSAGRAEELRALTQVVLMAPPVVQQDAWPAWVRALLALTPSYGDLTEDAYGERLDVERLDEDEGGVLDQLSEERRSTVEHCLLACTAPGAAARPDLAALVEDIARTKRARLGSLPYGDDQAAHLALHLQEQGHPEAARLRSALRAAFPSADIAPDDAPPR